MLELVKQLWAPKAGVRIVVRGAVGPQSAIALQNMVRSSGALGWIRIVQGSYAQIELEGSKPRLEALIVKLQRVPLVTGAAVLEVGWLPFKGQYNSFRVSM